MKLLRCAITLNWEEYKKDDVNDRALWSVFERKSELLIDG